MFQWRSARRTSGEKEGTWQEKVPSSAGEGRGGGLHFICIPTHTSLTFVNGVSSCFTHTDHTMQLLSRASVPRKALPSFSTEHIHICA